MKPQLIIIGGPTATGKTALSVQVAKRLDGEIVSCDSMQIYRRMDIGTAKVMPIEMQGVPHHLIDIVDPQDSYSVAQYQEDAKRVVNDILARGKVPIIVGGTGLYINAILYPMTFHAYSQAVRDDIQADYERYGNQAMYDRLVNLAPQMAEKLSPNDVKRVSRCLELVALGAEHNTKDLSKPPQYPHHLYVLSGDRAELYDRINRRVDIMMSEGLVQEVKELLSSGVSRQAQSFQAIAYKEMAMHLLDNMPLGEAVELIKKRSRNYAKRQLTWFRQYEQAQWLDYHQNNVNQIVEEYHD